jgi:hypothetical protein
MKKHVPMLLASPQEFWNIHWDWLTSNEVYLLQNCVVS